VRRLAGRGAQEIPSKSTDKATLIIPKLIGSMFRVHARPGATGCVNEIAFTFYGIGLPSPHPVMSGLGQGFKGYNCLKLFKSYHFDPPSGELYNRLREEYDEL
jgi:hypothetical protein